MDQITIKIGARERTMLTIEQYYIDSEAYLGQGGREARDRFAFQVIENGATIEELSEELKQLRLFF